MDEEADVSIVPCKVVTAVCRWPMVVCKFDINALNSSMGDVASEFCWHRPEITRTLLGGELSQWQECLDDRSSSTFYNFITCLWIKKYGWFFDHWFDLDEDTPDLEDDELDFKEAQALEENEDFEGGMQALTYFVPKLPWKPQILQCYSGLYYQEGIKSNADLEFQWKLTVYQQELKQWEEEMKVICTAEKIPPVKLKAPSHLSVQNEITHMLWNAESQEFCDEVEGKMMDKYCEALETHKKVIEQGGSNQLTAENYHA
ncbi:uncharacterized protein EDB91DRAFT_1085796 [Suillus paluster]|uniref:uncharacterized protein n=1 Tax=Suillus paluster TaxID=48578 RepID=UPI001B869485|nr:uncharacterized protein EDB91DRAFT_1085796 [Suillus paluster]KAG1729181.1 hypothetical protein EDB91DRAFT_1085796 [Suillus paluster]